MIATISGFQFVMFAWWAAVGFLVACVVVKGLMLRLLDRLDTWHGRIDRRMNRYRERTWRDVGR